MEIYDILMLVVLCGATVFALERRGVASGHALVAGGQLSDRVAIQRRLAPYSATRRR